MCTRSERGEERKDRQWVVTLNVLLSDPLTEAQRRNLERALLAAEWRSERVARLHVAVAGAGLAPAIDSALRLARQALVGVDAWFERVDVFGAHRREDWPAGPGRQPAEDA
jgi:hypothetical protein